MAIARLFYLWGRGEAVKYASIKLGGGGGGGVWGDPPLEKF